MVLPWGSTPKIRKGVPTLEGSTGHTCRSRTTLPSPDRDQVLFVQQKSKEIRLTSFFSLTPWFLKLKSFHRIIFEAIMGGLIIQFWGTSDKIILWGGLQTLEATM